MKPSLPASQAKLIKGAMRAAMRKLKEVCSGGLRSKLERRLDVCAPYIATSLSRFLASCNKPAVVAEASSCLGSPKEDLPQVKSLQRHAHSVLYQCSSSTLVHHVTRRPS